ncbi:MAG: transglutaminase-like cysteine peptidase [Gammaproteobacteria bacterium]
MTRKHATVAGVAQTTHQWWRMLLLPAAVLGMTWLPVTGMDLVRLQQAVNTRYGQEGADRVQQLQQQMARWALLAERDKLVQVNDFFNKLLHFGTDTVLWRQADYWATPGDTLGLGAGDCEDFTIIKYFTLKQLGVPVQRLRLTYVRARIGGPASNITQAHMVLTYYATPEAPPLVLDNLLNEIRPAARRPDLEPVFSFNSDGVWAGGGATPATPVERLSRWTNLMDRMQKEGSL